MCSSRAAEEAKMNPRGFAHCQGEAHPWPHGPTGRVSSHHTYPLQHLHSGARAKGGERGRENGVEGGRERVEQE